MIDHQLTAAEMLRPTLEHVERYRCVAVDLIGPGERVRYIAVLFLDAEQTIPDDEVRMACRVHQALDRGLLVVTA